MDFGALREVLSSAGDASTVLLLYVAWRLDRRLVKVETKLEKKGSA